MTKPVVSSSVIETHGAPWVSGTNVECPESTWVGLFVRGELPAEDVSILEAHIDACAHCLVLVADAAGAAATSQTIETAAAARQDSVWIHVVAALARACDHAVTNDPPLGLEGRFGPYRVRRVLGRGGMGIVYAAVHDHSGKEVAIKTVVAPSSRSLAAMRQEISFLRSQRHPGVVQIFEDGVIDGDPWYAMDLLEGRTLDDLNRSLWPRGVVESRAEGSAAAGEEAPPRPAPPAGGGRLRDALSIFARLCPPLSFVHRAGIVHCDLKPANVFVRNDEQPILMDFGLLSRASGAIGRETLEVGGLRGTLPYLAPELIRGRIPDARADLYALGCMLYESITGRPPFIAGSAHGLLEAHLYREPVPPSRLVTGLPKEIDDLIAGLLAKAPENRIGGADVVEEVLARQLETTSSPAVVPSKPYLFRPRLVGRDAVVEEIQALCRDVERGQGHLMLLGGESGIGKTFLASECAQQAMRRGFDIVAGECVALAPTALAPFHELLQRAADRCRGGGPDMVSRLFGSLRTVRLLSRYGPALQHVVGKDEEELPALPPPAERERVLDAMREVLGRLTDDAPLLLVIDDLQWADDLSLTLLDSLTPEFLSSHRLLVVALYRSEETSPAVTRLLEKRHVRSISLKRLDDGALTAMVGDLLSATPPVELMRALTQHSEGNPFFVAEYLRAAASEGRLVHTSAGWGLAEGEALAPHGLADLALPRLLQELVERRLRLLSEGAQRAAEVASVLGREFTASMLTAVARAVPTDMATWTEEMVERQLVDRTGDERLRFAHDKIRESAYARIETERRRALHRAAADALESEYTDPLALGPRYAELAYHCHRGDAPARAIEYFEKAAEHALRSSANADAVRFFREAIDTSTSSAIPVAVERRALWERRCGDALQGLGDLSGSKRHLVEALALLGHPLPASEREMGFAIARKFAKQIVHRAVPHNWIEGESGEAETFLQAARAYDRLMQIYYYTGEYTPLFFANLATLDLAERMPPSPILAVAYTNAAAVAGIVPLPRVASSYFRLAEATLKTAYDPEVESYLAIIYAQYQSGLGNWPEATAASDRGLEVAERLGFRRRWEDGAAVLCNVTWGRDFDDCLIWGERMYESAARRGDSQMVSWGLLRRAEVHAARGDVDAAEVGLRHAEGMVSALGRPEQIRALGLRSLLSLERGDERAAVEAADRGASLVAEAKSIHTYCIEPYARIAQVQLAAAAAGRGDPSKTLAACRALGAAARIFPIALPRYCLLEGARRWQSGKRRAAASLWQRGLRSAIDLHIPYEEALLRLILAAHGEMPPQASGEHRRRAAQIHRSLRVRATELRVIPS